MVRLYNMAFTKEEAQKEIISLLTTMTAGISNDNAVGFFDSNRAVQDFFAGLFGIMYGYKDLKDMDIAHDTTSFPAVDLGDEACGVAIQITSRTDREKIIHTIETFIKNGLHLTYPRLIVCMLGDRENYKDNLDLKQAFEFDLTDDIWDIGSLCKDVMKHDLDTLLLIRDYFDKYLKGVSKNRLFDDDIAESIDILSRNAFQLIARVENKFAQARIANRGVDFIEAKNELNNLTWDAFKVIQGHLLHNGKITAFLSNPINEDYSKKYLDLASTLQKYYTEHRDKFADIDVFMRYIFSGIDTYNTDLDSNKIKILLHNMYFNCDIGDNPQ